MKKNSKRCISCGRTKDLHKASSHISKKTGKITQYWRCRPCARKMSNKHYHADPQRRITSMMASMKSYAKRFGYRLVKINKNVKKD